MADVPRPVLILVATGIESVLLTLAVPQHLPKHPLLYVFWRLFAVQFALYLVYSIVIWPRFFSRLRHIPLAPDAKPIIGHVAAMAERPRGSRFLKWMKAVPNDGLIRFRGIFNIDSLVITDYKGLAEVLVTKAYDFEKPLQLRMFLRRVIGDGLIIVEGDIHKFQRKHVMPVFSFRHIKDLYPTFNDKSNAMIHGLAQKVAEQANPGEKSAVVEINHWANLVTMDIIGLAAMGRDFQSLRNTDDPLVKIYEELLEPTVEKQLYFVGQVFLPYIVKLLPWPLIKRVDGLLVNLNDICLKFVAEKRAAMKANSSTEKDILSLLIQSNNFSDQQLVDQLLTFLAAGHETTSSAFTWTTYLLTQHPKILADLRAEVRAAGLPSRDSPTPSNVDVAAILESLPILNGVCNETLRLYPTVPMTARVANKDTVVLGEHVPKGTRLQLCIYGINRHPNLWGASADEFVPERWIDTDPTTGERRPNASGGAPTNYALLTFLHGPRSCIGQGFAKAELRCLVAAFVNSFDFEMADPNEEIIVSGTVTTKPKNGMNLRMTYIGDQS